MSDPLNDRCKWILEKVKDFAGEHCEGFVFIATVKDPESGETRTPMAWDGGFNMALGMADRAHQRMRDDARKVDSPDESEDEGDDEDWKTSPK